jgi:gliding motility-associated-like protein
VSDNPFTIKSNDSTRIAAPLSVQFGRDTVAKCKNGEISIRPKAAGNALAYRWSSGQTTASIPVSEAGLYRVTVSSGCFSKFDSIIVIDKPLDVHIGPDHIILPGDSVTFKPVVRNYNPITSIKWTATPQNEFRCNNCLNTLIHPKAAQSTVRLTLTDDQGCVATDEAVISIRRRIYIPDAFSPNDDGYNDHFIINTERDAQIIRLDIYNRWGDRVFSAESNCNTNRQDCGWDGKFKGLEQNPGTFTYRAVIDFGDDIQYEYKGDLLLIRE